MSRSLSGQGDSKELAQEQRQIVLQPEEGDWEGEGQGAGAVSPGKRKERVLWVLSEGPQRAGSSGSWEETEAQGAGLLWGMASGVLGRLGVGSTLRQSVYSCTPSSLLLSDLFSMGIHPGFLLKKRWCGKSQLGKPRQGAWWSGGWALGSAHPPHTYPSSAASHHSPRLAEPMVLLPSSPGDRPVPPSGGCWQD